MRPRSRPSGPLDAGAGRDDPVTAGFALPIGPANPDRLVLTGLRRQLRPGQFVTFDLTFAPAGHAALRVPVIP